MARRKNNNLGLKSMEEFKCKTSALTFVFTILIAVLMTLFFFARKSTSQEVAKAEGISDIWVEQSDTEQQSTSESTDAHEVSNIVVVEQQFEKAESIENAESVENAESTEETQDTDSASESTTSEEQAYGDFIIPVTEEDIGLIVRAVQHEVGSSRSFYPDADLDTIQQCMARVIINQVLEGRWGNSVSEILFYPGHFMNIERLQKFDPYEETTRKNVLTVLRGEDYLSSTITIEMSFSSKCTFEDSIEIMESQVGPVIPYFWTVTAENRLLIFAESDKARLAG